MCKQIGCLSTAIDVVFAVNYFLCFTNYPVDTFIVMHPTGSLDRRRHTIHYPMGLIRIQIPNRSPQCKSIVSGEGISSTLLKRLLCNSCIRSLIRLMI